MLVSHPTCDRIISFWQIFYTGEWKLVGADTEYKHENHTSNNWISTINLLWMLETKGMKIHGKAKVQECQEEQVNINAVLLKLTQLEI